MLRTIRNHLFRSPTWKTAISFLISVLCGVFSSIFVNEISSESGIVWTASHQSISFWVLIFLFLLNLFFHRVLYTYEHEISAFKDSDFCLAYARSQLIPAQVAASKQAITNGDVEQFQAAMKQIKDVLK